LRSELAQDSQYFSIVFKLASWTLPSDDHASILTVFARESDANLLIALLLYARISLSGESGRRASWASAAPMDSTLFGYESAQESCRPDS